MKRLKKKIEELSKIYNLEDYEWDFPEICPIDIPQNESSSFQKNVYLKNNLKCIIKDDSSLLTHYWVIQQWGGIGGFKKLERNDKRIVKFLDELEKGKITKGAVPDN